VKLAKCVAEFGLIGANELNVLLAVDEKVELGDGANLESLSTVLTLISVDGTENNLVVLVTSGSALEDGLEAHAGATAGRPEVNHDTGVVINNFLKVPKTLNRCHFA